MKIVNLTPHAITLRTSDGLDIVLQPEPISARVNQEPCEETTVPGIPVPVKSKPVYGSVYGLPDPEAGTIYIVSMIVAQACPRHDLFTPATGPADGCIREGGNIVAVTKLNATV